MTVRHADGAPEPARRRYPSAEEMLGDPAPPVVAAPDGPDESDPLPSELRLVGSFPGGGGIWERARPGEAAPSAEAA